MSVLALYTLVCFYDAICEINDDDYYYYYLSHIPLGSSRHVSTRHDKFDVSSQRMHFGCVELVEQHDSTRSTRRTFRVVSRRDVTS